MAEVHTGGREDGPEVVHYLVRLIYDIGGVCGAGGGIDGDLPGDIQRIAGQNGLAVGAYGRRGVGGIDDLLFHGCKISIPGRCGCCSIFAIMKIAVIAGKAPFNPLSDKLPSPCECVEVDEVSELEKHRDAGLIIDLSFSPDKDRIEQLSKLLPIPVMVNSVIYTCEEIGQPFIRINAWPGMLEREVHELAVGVEANHKAVDERHTGVDELYRQLGWKYRLVPDVPGMISGRILATIINEAYYTLEENVSTKEEIDIAMKLGTNYPFGPFEWSERIGLANIYDLLNKLGATDSRYIPAKGMAEAVGNVLGTASAAHSD